MKSKIPVEKTQKRPRGPEKGGKRGPEEAPRPRKGWEEARGSEKARKSAKSPKHSQKARTGLQTQKRLPRPKKRLGRGPEARPRKGWEEAQKPRKSSQKRFRGTKKRLGRGPGPEA